MKSKTINITASQLNTGITVDTFMDHIIPNPINPSIDKRNRRLYPKQLQLINGSGVDLEFVIFSSVEEETEYTTYPQFYDYVLLPAGASLVNSGAFLKSYKIMLKTVGAGVALNPVRLDLFSFN